VPGLAGQVGWPYSLRDSSVSIWIPGGIRDNRRRGAWLLNNAKILRAREAYTDYDDPAERRHLLRLWLTAHAFATVEDTLRGGIPVRQQAG
jgi:hypothetical protein